MNDVTYSNAMPFVLDKQMRKMNKNELSQASLHVTTYLIFIIEKFH